MGDNIVRLPTDFKRRRILSAREIWDAGDPPDEMVWEICPCLREQPCSGCKSAEREGEYVTIRACRALAEEACRIVFAMQKRASPQTPSDE